jgi:hypothetical protein
MRKVLQTETPTRRDHFEQSSTYHIYLIVYLSTIRLTTQSKILKIIMNLICYYLKQSGVQKNVNFSF